MTGKRTRTMLTAATAAVLLSPAAGMCRLGRIRAGLGYLAGLTALSAAAFLPRWALVWEAAFIALYLAGWPTASAPPGRPAAAAAITAPCWPRGRRSGL